MSVSVLSPVDQAKADQGKGYYLGRDPWGLPIQGLSAGTKLVQLDWRLVNLINAGREVISPYFTNIDTLGKCLLDDGSLSPQLLAAWLQIRPHRMGPSGPHLYNPHIVTYTVQRDLAIHEFAEAPVENNLHYGLGKGQQYFLAFGKAELLKDKILSVDSLEVGTVRNHLLSWLTLLEQAAISNDSIAVATEIAWSEYTSEVAKGTKWDDVSIPLARLRPQRKSPNITK